MKRTGQTLYQVFSQPKYVLLSTVLAAVLLSAVVVVSQLNLVSQVVFSTELSFVHKSLFLTSLYGLLGSNFSLLSAIFTVMTVILMGVNVSLLIYYIKQRRGFVGKKRGHAAGIAGMVSGVFGIGCAACGSVLLTAGLSAVGAGGLLAFFPLHGAEFGLLGVLLLLFSIYQICIHVQDSLVCPT